MQTHTTTSLTSRSTTVTQMARIYATSSLTAARRTASAELRSAQGIKPITHTRGHRLALPERTIRAKDHSTSAVACGGTCPRPSAQGLLLPHLTLPHHSLPVNQPRHHRASFCKSPPGSCTPTPLRLAHLHCIQPLAPCSKCMMSYSPCGLL